MRSARRTEHAVLSAPSWLSASLVCVCLFLDDLRLFSTLLTILGIVFLAPLVARGLFTLRVGQSVCILKGFVTPEARGREASGTRPRS
jgi:hypothetical protein